MKPKYMRKIQTPHNKTYRRYNPMSKLIPKWNFLSMEELMKIHANAGLGMIQSKVY